jgi:poly(3-hydroxybutyrate) depolymerase
VRTWATSWLVTADPRDARRPAGRDPDAGLPAGATAEILPGASAGAGGVAQGGTGGTPSTGVVDPNPGGATNGGVPPPNGGSPGPGGAGSASSGAGGVGVSGSTGGASGTGGGGGASPGGATSVGDGSCGTRTGKRGKLLRTLTVGTMQRSYVSYLPASATPTTPVPFVYVFHGATQTGQELYDMTEYAKLADRERIAVVFPDGQGVSSASSTGVLAPWNVSDGPIVCGAGAFAGSPSPVDFAFLDAIKADVIFHGAADALIVAGCDDPTAPSVSGFPASATLWAQKNGCKPTYTAIPVTGTGGNDGQCFLYDGCPEGGQVELCTFPALPHAWAGAPVCAGCIGSGVGFPSATQLEWDFFKKYAW